MAGLSISICFWHLASEIEEDVLATLQKGKYEVSYCHCRERKLLRAKLSEDPPDLVISDFNLPPRQKKVIEQEMEPFYSEVPLVYLVDDENEWDAMESMKLGVWDYVVKSQLHKLVPSVHSSLKYAKLAKQRKAAERDLRRSRDLYLSIFQSVHDGILLIDFETREITEFNPRLLEMFNFAEEDLPGIDLRKYSAEKEGYTLNRAKELVDHSFRSGEPVVFEWLNSKKTGELFWTLNSISIVKVNEKPYILLVSRDIDGQKRMEQSLLESQEHFRALAENSPDVIMRFDRNLRHIYVNRAAENQTGYLVEDFLGKSHREMGVFKKENLEVWEDALEMVFRNGKPHTIVFEAEFPAGRVINEWRLYPETGPSEAIQSVVGVARDITDTRASQLALAQSEERLNLALDATGMGLWDWNIVTNEVYFSPLWFTMLGYEPDEMPQEFGTWQNLVHPDDRKEALDAVQSSIDRRESTFEVEFRMKQKGGGYRWIRSLGKSVEQDGDGNTTRLTGIHENVDGRKRNEMVRQVLFDISNAVSTTQSLDELYVKIRESLSKVLDTTNSFLALYNEESDTLTLPFMDDEKDSFNFVEFPARKTLTNYVIQTGQAQLVDQEREQELTDKGEIELVGTPCVSWLGVPLKHDNKTIGVFAVQSYTESVVYTPSDAAILEFASDQIALAIERRRHQDHIRSTQERQRRVFESSPDPMIVVDRNAMIVDFNSAFVESLNVDKKVAYGEKVFRFISKDDWRKAITDFRETWVKGYLKNVEYRVVRPDGIMFDAEVSSGAMYTSDGKPESMVLIVKNISERKEAERKLLEAKYKAEESDRLKTAFLSNMSHEIRTPMNAIVGFSDLLTDEGLGQEERRDFIAQINQGADDLMRLIDDIIDIAKIEAGQVNLHIAECFIKDLFKELHLMYIQNLKRSGKEHVELQIQWDWPFSDLAIYTDPFRLKQILVNLLSNAVKFTDEGTITLGLEEHQEGILFFVRDSGIGIREEKQKVIFDRFMQGHDNKTKLYGGTGLGLAISKNLTEILGGEIGVTSTPGEGATFWFILPRNEVPLKYEAALRAPASDNRNWKEKRLLIAEDDHSNYYFLYEALRETGMEILWAKDGEETLEIFRENENLDLVLMDINLPYINGYECTRVIKKERPGLTVVAQTAYAMSGEREISKEAGCDDYLAKPIKVADLLNTLSRYL